MYFINYRIDFILLIPPATDIVLAESLGRLPNTYRMQTKLVESQARYCSYWERLHSVSEHSRILHLAFTEHLELRANEKQNAGAPPHITHIVICFYRQHATSWIFMDLSHRPLLPLSLQTHYGDFIWPNRISKHESF